MSFLQRELTFSGSDLSYFLLGPRMTGKTTLLQQEDSALYVDLLDPTIELELKSEPKKFHQQISALPKNTLVIVDEIQRAPVLLDYVQMGIDRMSLRFILSGSSARKLRRGTANLLGGRAAQKYLHPLTLQELGETFSIENALRFGTLPKISTLVVDNQIADAHSLLGAYYTIYIKEEVQAEALTRNVGAFQRFLKVAAQCNGQVVEYSNISRESGVAASTVKEYFSILEDTLLARLIWQWDSSERKKARPKLYFFDCGVLRAIQNRLIDPPTSAETGFLFETWFVNELIRIRDYANLPYEFYYWRKKTNEIDILIEGPRGFVLAIECKSGRSDIDPNTVNSFRKEFSDVKLVVASLLDVSPRRLSSGVDVLPFEKVLRMFREGSF